MAIIGGKYVLSTSEVTLQTHHRNKEKTFLEGEQKPCSQRGVKTWPDPQMPHAQREMSGCQAPPQGVAASAASAAPALPAPWALWALWGRWAAAARAACPATQGDLAGKSWEMMGTYDEIHGKLPELMGNRQDFWR